VDLVTTNSYSAYKNILNISRTNSWIFSWTWSRPILISITSLYLFISWTNSWTNSWNLVTTNSYSAPENKFNISWIFSWIWSRPILILPQRINLISRGYSRGFGHDQELFYGIEYIKYLADKLADKLVDLVTTNSYFCLQEYIKYLVDKLVDLVTTNSHFCLREYIHLSRGQTRGTWSRPILISVSENILNISWTNSWTNSWIWSRPILISAYKNILNISWTNSWIFSWNLVVTNSYFYYEFIFIYFVDKLINLVTTNIIMSTRT